MTPKEKALVWLEKHGERIVDTKFWSFGYDKVDIEQALDITLKEQARQIFEEIEKILEEKLKQKYLGEF